MLKYLALGLLPVFWAIPGTFLYSTVMMLAEKGIYLLPIYAALLLFFWQWIGRNIELKVSGRPLVCTLLAHVPMLLLITAEVAAMKGIGLSGDAMLWIGAFHAAAIRISFLALCMAPLDMGGVQNILLQGLCTILPMTAAFWFGQIGAPFRPRTLLLPLAASLLFGFGMEWAYLPLIFLWLIWLGYDVWKWRE